MNTLNRLRLLAASAVVAVICASVQPSLAEDGNSSVSRAERKAQARAANKSGTLLKAGEGPLPEQPFMSERTRTDRKAETVGARKAGELPPPGEATYRDQAPMPFKSEKTRAERKSETVKAAKDGSLVPAGELGEPARLPGPK